MTYKAVINEPSAYLRNRIQVCIERRPHFVDTEYSDGGGHKLTEADLQGNDEDAVCVPEDVKLQWEFREDRIDFERVFKGDLACNSYHTRRGLCRKANLAHFISKRLMKRPSALIKDSWLKTVIIDIEDPSDEGALPWALADARDAIDEAIEEAGVVVNGRAETISQTPIAWILKPSMGDRGEGLCLVQSLREVKQTIKRNPETRQWVMQRYLSKPLLSTDGRKFHLRVYVLACGDLHVHVFNRILVLHASDKYEAPKIGQVVEQPVTVPEQKEGCMGKRKKKPHKKPAKRPPAPLEYDSRKHFTNSCYQTQQLRDVEELEPPRDEVVRQIRALEDHIVREWGEADTRDMLRSVWESSGAVNAEETRKALATNILGIPESQTVDPSGDDETAAKLEEQRDTLRQAIVTCTGAGSTERAIDTMLEAIRLRIGLTVREAFQSCRGDMAGFLGLPTCFELFGLDFLLDDQLRVFLLEINSGPDVQNTGDRLGPMVDELIEYGLFQRCIDVLLPAKTKGHERLPEPVGGPTVGSLGHFLTVYTGQPPEWR
eukprot:Clim_evm17s109 gene=Clim_evmTU17s109